MADKIGPFLTSIPRQCGRTYSFSIFVLPPKEKLQKTLSHTAFTSSDSSLSVTDPMSPPFPRHHGQGLGKVTHDLLMPGSPAFLRPSWHSQQHLFLETCFSFLKTLSTWRANKVASWFSICVMDSSSPSSSFLNVGEPQDSVLAHYSSLAKLIPLLLSQPAHSPGRGLCSSHLLEPSLPPLNSSSPCLWSQKRQFLRETSLTLPPCAACRMTGDKRRNRQKIKESGWEEETEEGWREWTQVAHTGAHSFLFVFRSLSIPQALHFPRDTWGGHGGWGTTTLFTSFSASVSAAFLRSRVTTSVARCEGRRGACAADLFSPFQMCQMNSFSFFFF